MGFELNEREFLRDIGGVPQRSYVSIHDIDMTSVHGQVRDIIDKMRIGRDRASYYWTYFSRLILAAQGVRVVPLAGDVIWRCKWDGGQEHSGYGYVNEGKRDAEACVQSLIVQRSTEGIPLLCHCWLGAIDDGCIVDFSTGSQMEAALKYGLDRWDDGLHLPKVVICSTDKLKSEKRYSYWESEAISRELADSFGWFSMFLLDEYSQSRQGNGVNWLDFVRDWNE